MSTASLFALLIMGVTSLAIASWTPVTSVADVTRAEITQPQALQIHIEPEADTAGTPKVDDGEPCSQELAYQFDMECAMLERNKSHSHVVKVLCCHRLEVNG